MTERTVLRRQQLEVQRNGQMKGIDDDDSEIDSITTETTEESDQDSEKIYDVERIVAERVDRDGKLRYLLMWANYPEDRASWEPPENIVDQDEVIGAWTARREQEKAGKLKAFDVAALESKQKRLKKEKEERQLRRVAKRRKLARRPVTGRRKAMTAGDSDDEPLVRRSRKGTKPAQESDDEDDRPLASRRRSSVDMNAKKKRDKTKRSRKDSDTEESEVASSDSFMAELREEARKQEARANREVTGQHKSKAIVNTTSLLEKRRVSDARAISQRSTDSPDARSPQQKPRELPRNPARTASRDLPKANQAPSMSTGHQGTAGVPPSRPRGRPPGSGRGGATRGGRAGQLPATSNVFSRSEAPKAKPRGLSHALNGRPMQADQNNKPDLSKNLSHARKIALAGRSIADGPPDIAVLGGLVNPAEIKTSRTAYQQLKPPEPRRTSSTDAILINSPPTSRRSSTARNVRFLDDSDDAAQPIFEEPSPIVENQSLPGRSDRNSPSEVQMVRAPGNNQSDVSGQAKIRPKPILRAPPIISNRVISNRVPIEKPFQPPTQPRVTATIHTQTLNERSLQTPAQSRADTIPSSSNARNIPPESPPVYQAPLQPMGDTMLLTNTSIQTMPVRPVLGKKKSGMTFSEYAARQGIEGSGKLVKQANFGKLARQILISFSGVQRSSQEPWVKEISSIDIVNFSHVCLSTHFKAQPPFINAPVLAHGSVTTNADVAPAMDRVAEHLRLRLGGLIFSHNSIAILLFPTKLDEWKFLEKTDVPVANGVALRYHIFKLPEFCPSIAAPSRDDVLSLTTLRATQPPYWSSAVEFFCALKYESLLPQLPPPTKEGIQEWQDRDNFFLLIPEDATPSLRFITMWLKNCKPTCKILTSHKPGSWGAFIKHVKKPKSAGAVLIHETFLHIIPKLPDLQRLFSPRSNFAIYSISDCTAPSQSLSHEDITPNAFTRTRLFPHGGAFFLTPSILRAEPTGVKKFLNWLRDKQDRTATPGTYKLLGCHGMRELLSDILNEKIMERSKFMAHFKGDIEDKAEKRGLSHELNKHRWKICQIVDDMMAKAEEKLPPFYDLDDVDEDERPIVCAPELIDSDDEPKLVEWFAWWAMQNLEKYKKFWVIGTDPSNVENALPWSPTAEAIDTCSTDSTRVAQPESPKSPFENNTRWKKSGFTAVTEVAQAPLFSTAPTSLSDALNDPISPLTSNPVLHELTIEQKIREENWTNEGKIRKFLASTGLTDDDGTDIAIRYLVDANADPDAAISRYQKSLDASALPLPQSPATHPQLDGTESVANRTTHNVASGSRSTSRPSSRSGAVVEEDGRRHIPASTRGNGSIRPEIDIRPGYVSPEDKEVWRSPSVLSMLPRNVRQNATAHVTNSRQRPNEDVGRTIRRDESGDVIMSEDSHHGITSGSPSHSVNDDAALRKGSDSTSGMFLSEYSRSQSPITSPVKANRPMSTRPSSSIEASTEWYRRKEEAGEAWNHVKVYGLKDAFIDLKIDPKPRRIESVVDPKTKKH